jgi:hypothetical protein
MDPLVRGAQFSGWKPLTEGELRLSLKEVVEVRGNRKQIGGKTQEISGEGMEGYAKAIVDLWRTQQALDSSLADRHPRGMAVKTYLSTRKRKAADMKTGQGRSWHRNRPGHI